MKIFEKSTTWSTTVGRGFWNTTRSCTRDTKKLIESLLDDLGTPIGVQQKLMRHSDIRTTMNHYGSAYETTKRRANTLVVGKLLPETMKAASGATIQ